VNSRGHAHEDQNLRIISEKFDQKGRKIRKPFGRHTRIGAGLRGGVRRAGI